jgi:hypothetical protein
MMEDEAIELSFTKARLRTPHNLAEFAPRRIALHPHRWEAVETGEANRTRQKERIDLPYRQNGVAAGL